MQTHIPTITYMKAGVNKSGIPKWKAWFLLPKEEGAKRAKARSKVFHASKPQAVKLAEAWRDEILGTPKDATIMTIADLMDDFYIRCEDTKLSVNTLRGYKTDIDIRIKPYFKKKLAISLTQREVEDFYRYLRTYGRSDGKGGLSDSTVRGTHIILHKAYKDAVRRGELLKNPVQVKMPQIHRDEALPFSYEEVAKLNRIFETHDDPNLKAAMMIGLHLSLRLGEVCGLQWGDIKDGMLSVKRALKHDGSYGVPKTKKSRRKITLTPELEVVLAEHKMQQETMLARLDIKQTDKTPVICGELGEVRSVNSITSKTRNFLDKYGFSSKLSFHNLRHTGATYMLQNGIDLKTVQERLGHATAGITLDTYAHVLDGKDAEAAMTMQNVFDTYCVESDENQGIVSCSS